MDDGDAEVIDDEMLEEDGGEIDDDYAEPEIGEPKQELSKTPMDNVRVFLHFVDGASSIKAGKLSEAILGVQNNGDEDIEIVNVGGRMMMPQQQGQKQEVVQNFTTIGYDKQRINGKSEASFYYAFQPNLYSGGRPFEITIEAYYKAADTETYYHAVPFHQEVNVAESTEGVLTEIVLMYITIVIVLLAGAVYSWNKWLAKALGMSKITLNKPVETGTANMNVNMEWIPTQNKKQN